MKDLAALAINDILATRSLMAVDEASINDSKKRG
jgi:hypothetical protein